MKHHIWLRALFVCVILSALFSTTALALEIKASDYLAYYSANAGKTQNGDLAIAYSVNGSKKMTSIGVTRIEVQKYNGSRWSTEEVYTVDDVPEFLTENEAHHSGKIVHTPESTGLYRALVTVYAKDGTGSDSRVVTTLSVRI